MRLLVGAPGPRDCFQIHGDSSAADDGFAQHDSGAHGDEGIGHTKAYYRLPNPSRSLIALAGLARFLLVRKRAWAS